ncbi:unnamed protein product, partial [Discosporangium mesarthrocarpum]
WTPLHHAAYKGRGEEVQSLLMEGADTEAEIEHCYTPLLLAAQNGQDSCI